ncbi:MAG: endonuclease [Pseudomonadota bacterium]
MTYQNHSVSCALSCWIGAVLAGGAAAGLVWYVGEFSLLQAAFIGAIVVAFSGALLTWLLCRPLPALGEAPVPGADKAGATSAPAPEPTKMPGEDASIAADPIEAAPAPTVSYGAKSASGSAPTPGGASAAAAPAATAAPAVKPSKPLGGEAELASRKGTWKYEGGAGATTAAKPKPAAKEKAPAKPAAAASDGDGSAPVLLDGPRDGGPDDLKLIKGVGPGLEKELHGKGVYHFDQIAAWTPEEVAWADQHLVRFKGRVSRDSWVDQAKILAAGGETEFSKRSSK